VASGGTFERLFEFIQKWSIEDHCDFPVVVSKLTVKNVSIPGTLWDYLGNRQPKVAKTNYPERWGGDEVMLPPREEGNLKALKQAHQIVCLGLGQKKAFAKRLALTQEFRESWLRSVVNELKKNQN